MMLTEEEAKTKTCHETLSRVFDGRSAAYEPTTCIGSACMAWRWYDAVTDDGTACRMRPTDLVARMPQVDSSPMNDRRGYCGKAGAP